jgi:hypothetical protein
MKNTRKPTKITLDTYAASHRAVQEMKGNSELPQRVKVRSSQSAQAIWYLTRVCTGASGIMYDALVPPVEKGTVHL